MTNLPEQMLSHLSELIASRFALHFPKERWSDLERRVRNALAEAGDHDIESRFHNLLTAAWTRSQAEALVDHLSVAETYFFREPRSLEILENHILPPLIQDRQHGGQEIKIWSAGCATGEEPYSIAMLLKKYNPLWTGRPVSILGTDLNPRSLRRASAGVYGEWSFRGAPPWLKENYFVSSSDGRWALVPGIRNTVVFSCLNLAEDVYPNGIDLILCRNVLMYFSPESRKQVVQNLYRSLTPGGWLIVSPAEASQTLYSGFSTVSFDGATFYRKTTESGFRAQTYTIEQCHQSPASAVSSGVLEEDRAWQQEANTALCQAEQGAGETSPASDTVARLLSPGDDEAATPATRTLSSSEAVDAAAMLLQARLCANQGKLAEALNWCAKSLAADKTDARAHYLCATILQAQGSFEEARAALKLAIYLSPDFILAHFSLGNLARLQGNSKESRKYLRNALALLGGYRAEEIVPESEGIAAGRLREIIGEQMPPHASDDGRESVQTAVVAGHAHTRFSWREDSR
jgi:chemotaxis protein methyltransferase CheR